MNDRIKELARQAQEDYVGYQDKGLYYEIFAKLIVWDNIQTLRSNGYDDAAQCLQDINFGLDHPV
jgi:biotin operon repressor